MIQSVDRAVRILKALAAGPGRLGVSELSARLGLAKGTVHGLLRTLQAHGLVEQHASSRTATSTSATCARGRSRGRS
jgi:DNA-binding IclR family transcriptional regulator